MASYLTPGVYIEEVPSGSASLSTGATAIAAFVGFTATAPKDDPSDPEGLKPRLVTSWSQFEDLYGGFTPGAMLPHSVYGWFLNGGSVCYIVRVPHNQASTEPGTLALPAADRALGEVLEFTSIGPGDGLSISIEASEDEPADDGADPEPVFDLNVLQDGVVVESYAGLSLAGDNNVVDTLKEHSERVAVATKVELTEDLDLLMAMPKAGLYAIEPAPREPLEVRTPTFAGSETKRHGINGLVIADDVTIVAVPDLVTAATQEDGTIDLKMWKSVQTALIGHCEAQANRMAVLDAPPGMGVQEIKEWRSDVAMYDSPFATMYYPWIQVSNPAATNGDSEILVPPSGHMAGLWARVDDSRGVWKAPANEVIRGALDVERPITKAEQGLLNPIGVNCIRPFGTRGIRVWGARTLSSDSDWRYVNVRRLFNTVEQTIMNGTQWVVFEPNDVKLWEGVKRTLNAYLRGLWTSGALVGATPEQAYFVKCDAENNPPESIDEGKLIIEVGIAPVKPAEFVIFRISQLKETTA
ncbi:phage tail sheath family protein [Nitriliruptor alkaliphilus]|uniref:phage tail sheath family protein n=1 Tax=Nitriliruptor alkaliphilus TaxID=427918 RepID=UPI000695FA40|nr:phage tail sheath subtilisin-like domain-containing protein [Nitriliruptor alkaliphilus]